MKRKKNMPLWLSMVFSLITCAVGLGTVLAYDYATEATGEEIRTEKVTDLVIQRTEAMNGYFAGEIEYLHASEQLQDIETGDLLEEDIASLKAYERTDIEIIENYEITEVTMQQQDGDGLTAKITVDWTVRGIGGLDKFSATYDVMCEKQGETLKLVEFF